MSGELNGTHVILTDSVGEIVGQGEMTITFSDSVIDISSKSHQDYITLMDGEKAGQQLSAAGTFVYNNDAQYQLMRANATVGTHSDYVMTYADTGNVIAFTGVPTAMSDALPHGDKVSTSVTFVSSQIFEETVVFTGVQIGQAIITGETVWYDSAGAPMYDLLDQGSTITELEYPLLYAIYGATLPTLPTETGSPFPYKIVADYTGA